MSPRPREPDGFSAIPGWLRIILGRGSSHRVANRDELLQNDALLWIDPMDYRYALAEAVEHLVAAGVNVSVYNLPKCVLSRSVWPYALQSISDWKNGFVAECDRCDERTSCSGFFTTGRPRFSRGVGSITSE